jgi:predicted transcriptional regulator
MEIIAQMLSLALEDTRKTRLMYQANLSYSQLIYYIDFLLDKEFLKLKNGVQGNRYCITDKGREFLESIDNVIFQAK